jgi:hypothetical protein
MPIRHPDFGIVNARFRDSWVATPNDNCWPPNETGGGVCLLFVLPIFGWWLPGSIRFLRNLPGTSGAQAAVSVAVAVIPVAIGFGPLMVLIALLRNPMAYVTNTGVMKESVFRQSPVSFAWKEVDHVYCWLGRDGGVVRITVVAADGRRVEFGKTGGVDFASMYELFQNQLGPEVVPRCQHGLSR